jgi:hypothetical protein
MKNENGALHTTVKPPVKRREFATWTIFLLNANIVAHDRNGTSNNTEFNTMRVLIPRGNSLDFLCARYGRILTSVALIWSNNMPMQFRDALESIATCICFKDI